MSIITKKKLTRMQKRILIGATLFQCALLGVLINATSVLMAQIQAELQISVGMVSTYYMIRSLIEVLGSQRFSLIFFHSNRARFMFLQLVLIAFGYLLLTFGANTWLWYASAVLTGFSIPAASIMVPAVLKQWFQDNLGFATGFSFAAGGLGGTLFNLLLPVLIKRFGWRFTIVILSLLMLLLGAAGLYCMFHNKDNEMTVETDTKECSKKRQISTSKVLLCAVVLIPGAMAVQYVQYLGMYIQGAGYALTISSTALSLVMGGNILGKLILGILTDKLGIQTGIFLIYGVAAAATAGLIFGIASVPILMVSSFLYGFVYALYTVGVSQCCEQVYGNRQAKEQIGKHVSINGLCSICFLFLIGRIYDKVQSFVPIMWLLLFAELCAGGTALLMRRMNNEDS